MLNPFAESIWTAEEPFRVWGCELGARMTVIRLSRGGLWVHAPLGAYPDLCDELDALGPVRWVVAPSRFHHLGLPSFQARYPEAELFASPRLGRAATALRIVGVLGEEPEPGWASDIDQTSIDGHLLLDEIVFFHRTSRTLILTDLMMSAHADSPASWRRVGRLTGIYERPGPPVEMRWSFLDRRAARCTVERILAWDFDRIILSHGRVIPTGGKETFRRAFHFLVRQANAEGEGR